MHLKKTNRACFKHNSNLPNRILLVDDESQIRELHYEILNNCGYNVDTAPDGIIAWNTLNESSYDLLITDNNMPRLTGLDLIKRVRFDGMTLPIILASGSFQIEELNPQLRIDAALLKPFCTDELLVTVEKVLHAGNRYWEKSRPTVKAG